MEINQAIVSSYCLPCLLLYGGAVVEGCSQGESCSEMRSFTNLSAQKTSVSTLFVYKNKKHKEKSALKKMAIKKINLRFSPF